MSAADWAQVGIAVATLVAALGAVSTAYLNYLTRPLLIRTREVHSDSLKEVLRDWRQATSNCVPDISVPLSRVLGKPLDVEGLVLFADLKEHVSNDIAVFEHWKCFRGRQGLVCRRGTELLAAVSGYLAGQGRVPVSESHDATGFGFSKWCVDWLYCVAVEKAQGRPAAMDSNFRLQGQGSPFVLVYGSEPFARTDSELKAKFLEELLQTTVDQINREVASSAAFDLLKAARELVECQAALEEEYRSLLKAIDSALAIPILPGDCEHIRRATDSFWPSWLRRRK